MSLSLFSHNSAGSSLSQKPQWEGANTYRISLSGAHLEVTIAGNYSNEFEIVLPENKNLYDESLYKDWPSFVLMDIHWKYTASKILWQETLGSLQMLAVVHKSPTELDSTSPHSPSFESIITRGLRASFDIPDGETEANTGIGLPKKYESVDINDTQWLKYTVIGGTANADMLSYSTSLSRQHYITVIFRVVEHQSSGIKNWYNVCLSDIKKIMSSFSVSHNSEN